MMHKVLLKPTKETTEPVQRKYLFKTMCKEKGKCCKLVIDSGSTENLVSQEMVDKLGLKKLSILHLIKCHGCKKDTNCLYRNKVKLNFRLVSIRIRYFVIYRQWMLVTVVHGSLTGK